MKPLRKADLTGTWATVLLPLDERERIQWDALGEQVDQLIAAGVDGVYTNGSAAEFWAQTETEFDQVSQLVARRCQAAGVPYQLGASHPSPQVALGRLRRAKDLAPGAIQVILPDWFPVSDVEVSALLRAMAAAAAPVPLVFYNPPHAKRVLTGERLGWMSEEVPEVVGVKVGDTEVLTTPGLSERVAVFVPGHHLASGYQNGAMGAYSNVACLNPRAAVRWWHAMERDPAEAGRTEERLCAFLDRHVVPLREDRGLSNAALDKLLATTGGWAPISPRLRWPYASASTDDVRRVRAAYEEELPEFAAE